MGVVLTGQIGHKLEWEYLHTFVIFQYLSVACVNVINNLEAACMCYSW
jgi:hypothetical protein